MSYNSNSSFSTILDYSKTLFFYGIFFANDFFLLHLFFANLIKQTLPNLFFSFG